MADYFVCHQAGATAANYGTWNTAATSMTALLAGITNLAGPSNVYIHSSHVDNRGAGISWVFPETGTGIVNIMCVNGGDAAFTTGGSGMGSTVGTLTTGAAESTNSNAAFSFAGKFYCYGVTLKAGSNTPASEASGKLSIGTAVQNNQVFENCTFVTNSTNASAITAIGTATSWLKFRNCTFQFGATGQSFGGTNAKTTFINSSLAGSTFPTTTFVPDSASQYGQVDCLACDWSSSTNLVSLVQATGAKYTFDNCKLPGTIVTGTRAVNFSPIVECRSASSSTSTTEPLYEYYYDDPMGNVQDSTTYFVTAGSAVIKDGTNTDQKYSLAMTPSATASKQFPLCSPWVSVWNTLTGSRTISMKIAYNSATALNGNDVWMEVEFLGTASTLRSSTDIDDGVTSVNTTMLDVTAAGSARTDTGNDWDGTFAAGQQNNTLTATVSIDHVGYVRARVCYSKQAPTIVYCDPKVTVA